MESEPQNPEFSINPEKLHPCLEDTMSKKGATIKLLVPVKVATMIIL